MEKRRVPAALHRELTEYAALLRALRVRDAMDLTKHLTKASPFALNEEELNSDDDLDEDEETSLWKASNPPTSHASGSKSGVSLDETGAVPKPKKGMSAKAKGKRKAGSATPAKRKQKQRRRDHWTRWPLLLEDVMIPEWTLEDEVAVIASQVMKFRPPPVFPVPVASLEEIEEDEELVHVMDAEVEEDDPDIPFYVPYLTSTVAEYLAMILGLLASLTPARPPSMQNRIEPLEWRTVIDMVVTSKFANAKVVQNVIKRMERIYGPSILPLDGEKATSFRAVERINGKDEADAKFEKLIDDHFSNIFKAHEPQTRKRSPSPIPLPKRKASRETRKEEAGYKARKRWTPKQKDDTSSKLAMASSSSSSSSAPPPDSEALTLRRSGRAKTAVTYLQVLPEVNDEAMQE